MSTSRSPNRWLAAGALLLGVLAPLAGSPFRSTSLLDRDGAGRIEAVELAGWIKERRPVRVIDLRDALRFEDFHLPTAARSSGERLADFELSARDTVVLYGDEAVVARALNALRASPASVRYMVDGVGEWLSDVMNPLIAPDATPEERAAFAHVAELSRYFGGLPRVGVGGPAGANDLLERTRRRGCAF